MARHEWATSSNTEPLREGDVFTDPKPKHYNWWTAETLLTVTGRSLCGTFVWIRRAKKDGTPDWRSKREVYLVGRAFVRLEKVVHQ